MSAAQRWAESLSAWQIPAAILAAAPESPWIHPPELFTVTGHVPDSPSHERAREVAPASVLDVGCGGGRATVALIPPVTKAIGVDQQPLMLDRFAAAVAAAGASPETILGEWLQVAPRAPRADVVVCHHVAYNVAELVPFAKALTEHAKRRVVLELPLHHPLTNLSAAWRHFWDLERPTSPTAQDALAVLNEAGLAARLQLWQDDSFAGRAQLTPEERARFTRIRLCLPPEREPELLTFLERSGPEPAREQATIWWDPIN